MALSRSQSGLDLGMCRYNDLVSIEDRAWRSVQNLATAVGVEVEVPRLASQTSTIRTRSVRRVEFVDGLRQRFSTLSRSQSGLDFGMCRYNDLENIEDGEGQSR